MNTKKKEKIVFHIIFQNNIWSNKLVIKGV